MKSKVKIRISNKCNTKCWKCFWFKRKDYWFLVSEAKYKTWPGKGFKILTPKQMLQRLPIVLAQVKTGNTFENILNGIRQIIYSLYLAKLLKIYVII